MKDSSVEWIGEIPEDWEVKRLQWGLSEIVIKNDPIQTENILSLTKDRGVIPYKDKGNQGNKSKTDCKDYKLAYPDTIVMNSMNVIIGSVGISDYFGCVSPVYYVYRARENNDIRFFNYIFQIPKFQDELKKYANGILEIRLRVSSENVLKRQVAFPKYELQKIISDALDKKVMDISSIELNINQEIESLEAYKKSVITEAVTKGLDKNAEMKDSGIEWIGEIPSEWSTIRLQDIADFRKGPFGSAITVSMFVEKGPNTFKIYEQKNAIQKSNSIGHYYITENKYRELINFSVKPQDIIVSCAGTIGSTYTLPQDSEAGIINQALMRVRMNELLDEKYFKYVFDIVIDYSGEKFSNGSAIKNIPPFSVLNKQRVCYPPRNEQGEIVAYLDKKTKTIDEVIAIKQNQLSLLDEYKKSLIYEYVTGKREV